MINIERPHKVRIAKTNKLIQGIKKTETLSLTIRQKDKRT